MSVMENSFRKIGKRAAIAKLYGNTPFSFAENPSFKPESGVSVINAGRMFLEGIDFDLVYFPLKHLGYKCAVAVIGELLSEVAAPKAMGVIIGISAKMDFPSVSALWSGVAAAAAEFGVESLSLDLVPSLNALTISISASGEIEAGDRPEPRSKDIICVSGRLGAAYLGLSVLEKEKERFNAGGAQPDLEKYRMMVGAYLKPELPAGLIPRLKEADVRPAAGVLVKQGLSDAVKRLALRCGLGAKVYAGKIPFEGNSVSLAEELGIDPISAAMNGGDDYKLLFVIPSGDFEKFHRDFPTFDAIGHLALPEVGTVLVTPEGAELPLKAQGWTESND